jgi:hypothetical protein
MPALVPGQLKEIGTKMPVLLPDPILWHELTMVFAYAWRMTSEETC